ncbi:hypothetical protein CORC01_07896 [Colletotrichum orchidophilum]|uniref:Uncharacterized protein n=1 Tax=Colletotrichum orchidophilum TaxID=1209926 RepID=A0A1G4B5M9_9PEZI|nr:uncharacterized protein CORC01_07896 [Colletotrichum orchidophilum]OHE96750.1 hypothetical protein CORC01_07896 [Colletotrichum orchidophilum]
MANPTQPYRRQQQTPSPTQRQTPQYIPPTPDPPSPDLTRHQSTPLIPLTHPPSPQTHKRHAFTTQASQHPPQQRDRGHRQSSAVNQDKRTNIPHGPSQTVALPPTPPSPDIPSRPSFATSTSTSSSTSRHPQIEGSSEGSESTIKARKEERDVEQRRPRRQRSRPKELEVEDKEVIDDSELLGAVLDGIGRMMVGTVAMRMDDAGRWRIRRGPGDESA